MLENLIKIFDEYYRHMDKINAHGFKKDLGCEVRERLQQLAYIVGRVRSLEETANKSLDRHQKKFSEFVEDINTRGIPPSQAILPDDIHITREEFEAYNNAEFEMKLLTECFYYLAGRVRTIIKNSANPLPGLSGFECKGVRDVRNKLLEHAESKDSQVFIQSFGWGAPRGPVIKAARNAGQENVFPDKGLYENAKEFSANLERLILAQLPAA